MRNFFEVEEIEQIKQMSYLNIWING
jgi:hypothetical protein